MRRLHLFLFPALFLISCAQLNDRPSQPQEIFPTPIIQLRGSPTELGEQHASQLGPQIKFLQKNYLDVYLKSPVNRFAAKTAAILFEAQLPEQYHAEIHAMAQRLQTDETELMLAQCFLDLTQSTACSTITLPASASPDGVPRFGRNLDFPALNVADHYTVVLIFHPDHRYAFAAVSWPGLIGVLSGMNEHGLCLANMEVNRHLRWPSAMPYTLLYRSVLEQCRTVDEAIALLQKTPRQSSNNLMLMDATGDRAVVEITPEHVNVRRSDNEHALISTNHQRDQDVQTRGLCWRYDALHDMSESEFGSIDEKSIGKMLAKTAQGNMTLQSMIFEPKTRVMYLATGADAPMRKFYRLDLNRYFTPSPSGRGQG
jgi:isopenicillin-N N-acyltransferase-like protein